MNFIKVFIEPIYNELVRIINEVSATDLENEAARVAVFQKITDYVQSKGLAISDSLLNLSKNVKISYIISLLNLLENI